MKTKSVFYIYGEPTTTISFKVPESKKKEIMDYIRDNVLSKYENPTRMDVITNPPLIEVVGYKNNGDSPVTKVKRVDAEKKSNPADIVYSDTTAESYEGKKINPGVVDEPGQYAKPSGIKFEKIASLPLGTELLEAFGSKGALRTLGHDEFFTKRTHEGKLEILKHESKDSAFIYAEQNFK